MSIFKHFTDLFILKVDFVPIEALQPLLCVPLSGEQTDCNEVDCYLPEVSGSLSVIFLSLYSMIFLGWVFNQSQSFSNSLFSLVCLDVRAHGREAKREAESETVFFSCVDR